MDRCLQQATLLLRHNFEPELRLAVILEVERTGSEVNKVRVLSGEVEALDAGRLRRIWSILDAAKLGLDLSL